MKRPLRFVELHRSTKKLTRVGTLRAYSCIRGLQRGLHRGGEYFGSLSARNSCYDGADRFAIRGTAAMLGRKATDSAYVEIAGLPHGRENITPNNSQTLTMCVKN